MIQPIANVHAAQINDQAEYNYLIQDCRAISHNMDKIEAEMMAQFGIRGGGQQAKIQAMQSFLLRVGTPTAFRLWGDLERNGWKI